MRRHRYLPTGALIAAVVFACAFGCGPIDYLNQVGSKAAGAVAAAKRAQADRHAPFEFTAAQEYLRKAREEAGYSQYESSIAYGHKAEELANRARAIAIAAVSESAPPAPGPADAGVSPPAAPPAPGAASVGPADVVDSEEPGQPSKKPAPPRLPRRRTGNE